MDVLIWVMLIPTIVKGLPYRHFDDMPNTADPIFQNRFRHNFRDLDTVDIYEDDMTDDDHNDYDRYSVSTSSYGDDLSYATKPNSNTDTYGDNVQFATNSPMENKVTLSTMRPVTTKMKDIKNTGEDSHHHHHHHHHHDAHHLHGDEKQANAVELQEKLNATLKPSTLQQNIGKINVSTIPNVDGNDDEKFQVFTSGAGETTENIVRENNSNKNTEKINTEKISDGNIETTKSTRRRFDENETQDRIKEENKRVEDDKKNDEFEEKNDNSQNNREDIDRSKDAENQERSSNMNEDENRSSKIDNKESDESRSNANDDSNQGRNDDGNSNRRRNDDGDSKRRRNDDDGNLNQRSKDEGRENTRKQRSSNDQNRNRERGRWRENESRNYGERHAKATPRPAIACDKRELCKASGGRYVRYQDRDELPRQMKGYYKHPEDASYFYTCQHGIPSCLPCPTSKLSFSEQCQMCLESNDDEYVACPTTKPVMTQSISEIERGCSKDYCRAKENGHFSNRDEKSIFYMCSNSITYCMNCPSGLVFDETCVKCVGEGDVGKDCED